MTDKLKAVVEAVGECWHEASNELQSKCRICGVFAKESVLYDYSYVVDDNPSHTDLNELFRLAEKLGYDSCLLRPWETDSFDCTLRGHKKRIAKGIGATRAEALLNALTEAIRR